MLYKPHITEILSLYLE